jgi:hypothetical protein
MLAYCVSRPFFLKYVITHEEQMIIKVYANVEFGNHVRFEVLTATSMKMSFGTLRRVVW